MQRVKGESLAFAGKENLGTTSHPTSMPPHLASRDRS